MTTYDPTPTMKYHHEQGAIHPDAPAWVSPAMAHSSDVCDGWEFVAARNENGHACGLLIIWYEMDPDTGWEQEEWGLPPDTVGVVIHVASATDNRAKGWHTSNRGFWDRWTAAHREIENA